MAEICHFNTPKYKNQFSKKNQQVLIYVGLDYIFINILTKSLALIWEIYIKLYNKCIMYTTFVENCISSSS